MLGPLLPNDTVINTCVNASLKGLHEMWHATNHQQSKLFGAPLAPGCGLCARTHHCMYRVNFASFLASPYLTAQK
jgi:hypothetical protein